MNVYRLKLWKYNGKLLTQHLLHGEKQYEEFGRSLLEAVTNLYF